jgi:diacylglycerol kinase (ATP)
MRINIIANGSKPGALRHGQSLHYTLGHLHDISLHITSYKGHAREIASQIAIECEIIICIGGDGTISECASGIADASLTQNNNVCRLMPIPMGTGNDFIKSLPGKMTARDTALRIGQQNIIRCDLFCLTSKHDQHYFINACSAGLGPEVVKKADQLPAMIKGNLRFHLAILITFFRYRKKKLKIITPHWQFENTAMAIVCANGQFFGGGIGISPESKIDDRILNITIIGNVGILDYLKYVPALKRGEKIKHPEVHYLQCRSAELFVQEVEKDGEFVSGQSFKIEPLPFQIELI